jgi:hypothetical protein
MEGRKYDMISEDWMPEPGKAHEHSEFISEYIDGIGIDQKTRRTIVP